MLWPWLSRPAPPARDRETSAPRPVASRPIVRAAGGLLAASIAALAAHAAAEEPRSITLRWTAPASCPDAAAVDARIDRLLGGPPRATDRRLDAAAKIEPTTTGFRLELTLSTEASESTRILQGASCETVADAGALVIALAFDPDAVAAQEQKLAEADAGAPDAPPLPPPTATVAATAAPAPTELVRIPVPLPPPSAPVPAPPPPDRSLTFSAFAALLGDAGSIGDVAPGLRAGVALGIGAFRIAPAFEAWPSSRRTLADRPAAGADLRLLTFALDGCWRLLPPGTPDPSVIGFEAFSALICTGIEAGEMHADGFGVKSPGSAGVLWGAARGSFRGELPIASHLSLTLDVGIAVALDRRPFVMELAGERAVVHEPSVVLGRAGLGASLRF